VSIHQDVRFAVRRLLVRPAYAALIVFTLALGIGASTAVFSVVDQTILRPAPFLHADRLVDVLHIHRIRRSGGNSLTPQKIVGWQQQPALFERLEGAMPLQMDVTGTQEPERLSGMHVSLGLFSMLGVRPQIGRPFEKGDGAAGSGRVVIISHELWRRRFGSQADAIGQQMTLNDEPYTIVGVMPRRFVLHGESDAFWLPVDLEARITDTSLRSFYGIGRLSAGVPHERAKQIADEVADRLQAQAPLPETWGLGVARKRIANVDDTTRTALLVLLGAVGFVLLITCANVANLFLSQAPARQREMAIQSALGASRGLLIRSVMIESLLLAAVGGTLGILLAAWGVDAVIAAAPARLLSRITTTIENDGRVLTVAVALIVLTGILFGLVPAVRGSRPNLETTLRGGSHAAGRSSYGRVPGLLVVVEVAFAVILLVGAVLMARTLANLHAIEPGFEPHGLVALHVQLPTDRYPTHGTRVEFFSAVSEQLLRVPGISGVTVSQGTPPSVGGISFGKAEVEGKGVEDSRIILPTGHVSPSFFDTMRIPLLAGRNFETGEPEDHAIVSKALADRFWPDGNALGRRFRLSANWPWQTVIGVVGNVQAGSTRDERTTLQMYNAYVQRPAPPVPAGGATPATPRRRSYDYRLLIVRAQNPNEAIPRIKEQIWGIDPKQPVERVALVEDTYAEMFAKQRFVLLLMGAFATVALVLTAAGFFGVLSQVVALRTREIGIRVALGARPADVMKLVLSRGMLLAGTGAVLGIGGALTLVRTVQALLYGVKPTDWVSFMAVTVLLLTVALVACWLPTRTALRVQPAWALRVD
jgi:putative ABC transport system permease protein